ncbi:MAG: penicillin-binding protein 1A [Alphaproteobacteria bacterium]|nr:penicillin-binding protein 1A [Alphaproteobacteria bacterium]
MKIVRKILLYGFTLALLLAIGGGAAVAIALWRYGIGLPDYSQLATYEPSVTTRVHAGDGRLITEFAREKRLYVPYETIPKLVIQAFVSAEDQNFFVHRGVDPVGIIRAAIINLQHAGEDRRLVGASTITQQVAKNFFLSGEVSYQRKIKEAILAFRIERTFSKERLLELYLNEIYLGNSAYGVAAAALNYFDKPLADLTLEEAAYLAALPKAPNNYHPARHYDKAVARRNYVLSRMVEDGYISAQEAWTASQSPLKTAPPRNQEFVHADHFAEEVRRELINRFGEDALYDGGLSVRTSLDPRLQKIAYKTLRDGLIAYDRRHGWHGPITRIDIGGEWANTLAAVPQPAGLAPWRLAVVLKTRNDRAEIGFADSAQAIIPFAQLRWARKRLNDATLGPPLQRVEDVLHVGDVVAVAETDEKSSKKAAEIWSLQQIPEVGGALVAMDPHTGRVLAMQGGFAYGDSEFNRATQAHRQPGSAFKPFVYASALESGFTPSSLVLDAPMVIDQGPGLAKWKPSNYSREYYGPSTLRLGLEKSRNLMTVRLAQHIGIKRVNDYASRFGLTQAAPSLLSTALGAGETTLLKLTTAYAMFVNGGRLVTPALIDRVQDRRGKTLYRNDPRECAGCRDPWREGLPEPVLPDLREQRVDPATAYQIVSMLEGVVLRGTGRRVASVGKPLAGKTGTTNDSRDTWFIGFSPDLVAGVFIGFDVPRSMGKKETGSSVSAPVFRDFMAEALADSPATPFRIPPGIRLVRVNAETGLPANPGDRKVILEAFLPGTEPKNRVQPVLGTDLPGGMETGPETIGGEPVAGGTGGLY